LSREIVMRETGRRPQLEQFLHLIGPGDVRRLNKALKQSVNWLFGSVAA
jgi:hypothetical protein